MTRPTRPPFRPTLVPLEDRVVPAWWTVGEPDVPAGVPGSGALPVTGELMIAPALFPVNGRVTVEAPTAEIAIKTVLTAYLRLDAGGPQPIVQSFSYDQAGPAGGGRPFALSINGDVATLALEEKAGYPGSDGDYDDRVWTVRVAAAAAGPGGAGFVPMSAPPGGGSPVDIGPVSSWKWSGPLYPVAEGYATVSLAVTRPSADTMHWTYTVVNNTISTLYDSPGLWRFNVWAGDASLVRNMATSLGNWIPTATGTLVHWNAPSQADGPFVPKGSSATFSFDTPPVPVVPGRGRVEAAGKLVSRGIPGDGGAGDRFIRAGLGAAIGDTLVPGIPASVGDRVWDDLNGNGVQDDGEPGRGGVTVRLLGGGGVLATTVTNGAGEYKFGGLAAGSYQVQFVNPDPAKYWFPDPDQADDTIDSDGYPDQLAQLTATTKAFALATGENRTKEDQAVTPKIESVKWVSTGTDEGGVLGDQPAGTPGGGQRIFAERKKYRDAVVADKVTVKVQLTVPMAGVTVNGYVYDVDDPSSNDPKLDLESRAYDNTFGADGDGLGRFSGTSNAQGVVTATIKASHAPGDNYRAVATTNGTLDLPTVIKTKQDDADRAGVYFANGTAPADGNDVTVKSGLLTVWRTLHLGRDQMRKPDPAQPAEERGVFGGNTDDPEPLAAIPHVKTTELATQLRAAYIDALDDLGATNAKPDFKFVHNLGTFAAQKDLSVGATGNGGSRDVVPTDPFWSVQILSCYEGPVGQDYDPTNSGKVLFGRTGFGVAIFTESIRDWCANTKEVHPAEDVLLQRVLLHEVLHALGIGHGNLGGDEGPLDPDINTNPTASQGLTPTQIRLIREGGPYAIDVSPIDAP